MESLDLNRVSAVDRKALTEKFNPQYVERMERYKKELLLAEDDFNFSERDLVEFFKDESSEMMRCIIDSVRDSITHNPENKLKDFIDFGGSDKEKPLSYSTIEQTFYSFFICPDPLDAPISQQLEGGDNPRELEKKQILGLMNIIADKIYIGRFDSNIGTYRIEERLQAGDDLPLDHVRAYRVSREEILGTWLKHISRITFNYLIMLKIPIEKNTFFLQKLPDHLLERFQTFIQYLRGLPVWSDVALSSTIFCGKQSYDFWEHVFETAKTPQGQQVFPEPIRYTNIWARNV